MKFDGLRNLLKKTKAGGTKKGGLAKNSRGRGVGAKTPSTHRFVSSKITSN